jgi:hypothetical protein
MVLGGGGGAGPGAEDAVVMELAAGDGEDNVVTVNCPDQAGLGCDLCRTILEFGLRITRGGNKLAPLPRPEFPLPRPQIARLGVSIPLLLPTVCSRENRIAWINCEGELVHAYAWISVFFSSGLEWCC